jgi:hypothetical protein
MAQRIEIKGPLRYVLVSLLILLFAGNWLVPDLLAGLTGSGGRSWRLLRSGHVERYHRNLTDHWITAERGTYSTGMFPVLGGEDVIVEFDLDQTEGSVGFRLIRYHWGFWREHVWSEGVRKDQAGRFRIPVPETGLYGLRLSYSAFAGDVAFDWSVDG